MLQKYCVALLCVAMLSGCSDTAPEPVTRVDIVAPTNTGEEVEIRVYPEPLDSGGYVINVKRPNDPPGECWGTTIYPFDPELDAAKNGMFYFPDGIELEEPEQWTEIDGVTHPNRKRINGADYELIQ